MTHERDTSSDTTVPHLEVATITLYAGEDEAARQVEAHRYGVWAYCSEQAVAAAQPGLKKPRKDGTARPRTQHLVHVPSGRSVATVSGELAADTLARGVYALLPTWGAGCTLGDTPDDGDEVRALVLAVAEVSPNAVLASGHPARAVADMVNMARCVEARAEEQQDAVDEGVAA